MPKKRMEWSDFSAKDYAARTGRELTELDKSFLSAIQDSLPISTDMLYERNRQAAQARKAAVEAKAKAILEKAEREAAALRETALELDS